MSPTGPRGVEAAWPPLALEEWRPTKETLHRYCQMIGKVRLRLQPFHNHWWHATLHVDVSGLTTGPMPVGDGRLVEVRLDLVEHYCEVRDSTRQAVRFQLAPDLPCAGFHDQLFGALDTLQVPIDIDARPHDLPGPAFPSDHVHATYDPDAVHRYWQIMASSAMVLEEFAGWFTGKHSPVHLFWHTFDLAHARFSGRRVPVREGAGLVEAEAYSHEVIAFGFWPGDDKVPFPAYYCYTAPAPMGLVDQALAPAAAYWNIDAGTATLAYDDLRIVDNPRAVLLEFFQSAYLAGATTAGWDVAELNSRPAASTATDTAVRPRPGVQTA